MTGQQENRPLSILLAALGGEGGGVLMNWIVAAARAAGHEVQATSVPGVAQRTGSTSYHIEIAAKSAAQSNTFSLVPMPARVDVVVSSELVETARVMEVGFVSPDRTTLISSTAREFSTAEKIAMGDGRYSDENVRAAAEKLARRSFLLDLGKLAADHGTFVSATMFGALAGSGALPWGTEISRAVLGDASSRSGFDAACAKVELMNIGVEKQGLGEAVQATKSSPVVPEISHLPSALRDVIALGYERTTDFQDPAYGDTYLNRTEILASAADLSNHHVLHAVTEACRRLALWMAYEDIARVSDLKTRPERFERIRDEVQLESGQTLTLTEFLKPRAEEVADVLHQSIGRLIMRRAKSGKKFPFLGRGIHIRSNGVLGFWMLRLVASLRRIRRRSYRFQNEQAEIEVWLCAMQAALPRRSDVAAALAELPRVLKGYSDTLVRGKSAYRRIMDDIVHPAIAAGNEDKTADALRAAIAASLEDDTHQKLDHLLSGRPLHKTVPDLNATLNA